jgi:hypothetical protein
MRHRDIQKAIEELAEEFAREGRTLDLRRAAFGLWTRFPNAPFTLDEMADLVYQTAGRHKTAVYIDHSRPDEDQVDLRTPDVMPVD